MARGGEIVHVGVRKALDALDTEGGRGLVSSDVIITSLFIFALAGFLGFECIRRVPKLLHTPLMALTNALSAIALVGSLVILGQGATTYVDDPRLRRRGGLHASTWSAAS